MLTMSLLTKECEGFRLRRTSVAKPVSNWTAYYLSGILLCISWCGKCARAIFSLSLSGSCLRASALSPLSSGLCACLMLWLQPWGFIDFHSVCPIADEQWYISVEHFLIFLHLRENAAVWGRPVGIPWESLRNPLGTARDMQPRAPTLTSVLDSPALCC